MKKKVLICLLLAAAFALGWCVRVRAEETPVRKVELNYDAVTVRVGQTRLLYEIVWPADATNKQMEWSSSNENIVAVEQDGTIIGVSPGTAAVTARAASGRSASCQVTVPGTVLQGLEEGVPAGELPGAQLSAGASISSAAMTAAVEKAFAETKKSVAAVVEFDNKSAVEAEVLRAGAFQAELAGRKLVMRFRTTSQMPGGGTRTEGRLTVDTAGAAGLEGAIAPGVTAGEPATAKARQQLEARYTEPFALIALSQKGGYGMTVRVAARPDLSGMDTTSLLLYHWDGNALTLLENTAYSVDGNGYLHLDTTVGDTVVVTDRPLEKR